MEVRYGVDATADDAGAGADVADPGNALGTVADDPEAFARRVQRAVLDATRLHCSVGIGDNKLRAKIATEFGKPQGMFRLTEENWYAVMADRPTDALWGIGRKTAKRLAGLGITTVGELALADPRHLAFAALNGLLDLVAKSCLAVIAEKEGTKTAPEGPPPIARVATVVIH